MDEWSESWTAEAAVEGERSPDPGASSEAFGTLANEVRVTVLVRLVRAERDGETPVSFSDLHAAADTESSAGFAYHLRQLTGRFVEKTPDGYVLTDAGRRAADAVLSGAFLDDGQRRAS
ncbi:DUF7347 domain-containing protein [Salarchaeum japonicum]|uniref:DUF7347 domain-containing protein n=1 Tax=Salarchaeum japonicum TaxID=555573 RepID=A0AAV3SYB9_9EURY|nr:hypothetical protein [Salarchaeum japonicum]